MKTSTFDLLTIGESLRDVFYLIHEATVQCLINKPQCLLCLHYQEKIPVDRVVKVPAAGNSANAAVCASRLGLKTALVSWIGDDNAGRHIQEQLNHDKVDTSCLMTDKHPTSESTIIDFQGEKTQLVYFQPRAYPLPKFPATNAIYYSAMGIKHSVFDEKLLRYLHAYPNLFFAFQPGSTHIKAGLIPTFKRLIARSDLFILNREEAALLLRDGDEMKPRLQAFLKMGAKRVIITDGKKGATGSDGEHSFFMPAYPKKPIETTGAGDSFAATVTSMILLKKPFDVAMHAGSAMASSVIQHIGPQAGLLKTKDLLKILRANKSIKPKRLSYGRD